MKIKITFEDDCPDFVKLSKQEPNARKRIRLVAMAQLKSGKPMYLVASSLGVARHSVGTWYARYKNIGVAGLSDQPRPGPSPKIPKNREQEFIEKIESMQATRSGGRVIGTDIQKMAQKDFGATYAKNSIYAVLGRLKVACITARSRHPKSDEEAQKDFKSDFKSDFKKKFLKSCRRESI